MTLPTEPHPLRKVSPKERKKTRTLLIQGLYQFLLTPSDATLIENQAKMLPIFQRCDALFYEQAFHGVIDAGDQWTTQISPFLDRPWSELAPIEQAILMLALYELTEMNTPTAIVLNEAIELAKVFGGTDSYKYINGVLDRFVKSASPSSIG